ncbi:FAD-dependent oxidoreductase [Moorella naiadis]|uniref:FAD-dependent oxidoreductase n=1 Tax=Moorella naiadis (nom. illeg.) TaxID=3093670 RepID=UPI003D9CBA5A
MQDSMWDVLVLGGGPAGCFAAIKAREAGAERVLLVDKGYVGKSGCATFGAGSFKGFIPQEDDYELWFSKAVEEGYYMNDQEWIEIHLAEVFHRVKELEKWGVEFEKNPDGTYRRIEGQGSSEIRPIKTLMFHGPQLMDVLRRVVLNAGVKILDKVMVTDLLHDKRERQVIRGALGFHLETGDRYILKARAVVLSTGGQSYKSHYAYHKMVTGDGHIMGLKAGAELMNYEYTLHHLSYAGFDTTGMNVIQGLGALFVNRQGEQFMGRYDPEHKDHGSLNRISAAMAMEVRDGRGPLYMDFSSYTREDVELFARVLPILYRAFERGGIIKDGQFVKKKLEWVSVMSGNVGFGGGLRIDTSCRTTLEGLFAAGDATCGPSAGVEGFCAYAIPFATTSGARAGHFAALYARDAIGVAIDEDEVAALSWHTLAPLRTPAGIEPDHIVLKVQETIFPMEVYILRHESTLQKALNAILWLRENELPDVKAYDYHYLRMALEARNMVLCAEMFLRAALLRTESRGSHLRLDYPEMNNIDWLKWIVIQERNGELTFRTEDIPVERYRLKAPPTLVKHPVIAAIENNVREG